MTYDDDDTLTPKVLSAVTKLQKHLQKQQPGKHSVSFPTTPPAVASTSIELTRGEASMLNVFFDRLLEEVVLNRTRVRYSGKRYKDVPCESWVWRIVLEVRNYELKLFLNVWIPDNPRSQRFEKGKFFSVWIDDTDMFKFTHEEPPHSYTQEL